MEPFFPLLVYPFERKWFAHFVGLLCIRSSCTTRILPLYNIHQVIYYEEYSVFLIPGGKEKNPLTKQFWEFFCPSLYISNYVVFKEVLSRRFNMSKRLPHVSNMKFTNLRSMIRKSDWTWRESMSFKSFSNSIKMYTLPKWAKEANRLSKRRLLEGSQMSPGLHIWSSSDPCWYKR